MRALWLEDRKLRLRDDVPKPPVVPGEAVVRVALAGVCNTDLELVQGYYPYSGVPGHEFPRGAGPPGRRGGGLHRALGRRARDPGAAADPHERPCRGRRSRQAGPPRGPDPRADRLRPALALLARGAVDPRPLVEARYPLADAVAAFQHAARPGARKILVDCL